MSFTGDLQHLPIVDVIQLLHATKKSGTLTVKGRRGQCELAFSEGYIVSAVHARRNVDVGQVLVDLQRLDRDVLDRVLAEKQDGGPALVARLIEGGHIGKEVAFKGLETLIEMTIVEILTWSGGSFTLDVDRVEIADDYRYFPEQLHQDFTVSTQNVLMDSLRIYDEKKRDGELADEDADGTAEAVAEAEETAADWTLSADDLGLSDLDRLEKKIPGVFSSLPDIDPLAAHRVKLSEIAGGLSAAEQEDLLAYLGKVREEPGAGGRPGGAEKVVLFSPDELFRYMLTAACKNSGVFIFATDDAGDLPPIIEQSLGKESGTLLILDRPDTAVPAESMVALRRKLQADYPHLPLIQLAPLAGYEFTLQAIADGLRSVFPRPAPGERPASFAADLTLFLDTFRPHLQGFAQPRGDRTGELSRALAGMYERREAPEIAAAVLQFVAGMFVRALTLVVGPTELIAEKGIGVPTEGKNRPGFRIPLATPSLLSQAVEDGRLFFGASGDDAVVRAHLFAAIGAPRHATCLLLPLRSRNRTVALIYADFGDRETAPVPTDCLEILAGQAGLVLENALLRKKLEKPQ